MHGSTLKKFAAIGTLLVCGSLPDRAAHATEVARTVAQALFEEARQLMETSRYAEACPKLEESQRLDPAAGTVLNLALCYERLGKPATAWLKYKDAVSFAVQQNDPERKRIATERAEALSTGISRVSLQSLPEQPSGLWLKLDGVELSTSAWRTEIPVDPGAHRFEWGAPGLVSRVVVLEVAPTPHRYVVVTPELEALPREPRRGHDAAAADDAPTDRSDARALLAGLGLGLGAAGVIATTYFGIRAKTAWDDRNAHCVPRCDERAVEDGDRAHTFATVANVSLAVTAIGLGTGALFLFLSAEQAPPRPPPAAFTTRGASIKIGGSF